VYLNRLPLLAALMPKPRVNLTRYHGVFAPNSKYRVEVTPAKRGQGRSHPEGEEKTPEQHHQAMNWAQRLKRVFNIPQGTLSRCSASIQLVGRLSRKSRVLNRLRQNRRMIPVHPSLSFLP
jgi:hypothetical protein